jgi:hypothetical protein|tara:strand:- start:49 stop:270 length:222 start_codon:yes stop_codon:yes gene_type:complete
MATDKQILQWIRQNGNSDSIPENLYWFAEVNESNVVEKIVVYDPLQKTNFDNYPERFPSLKAATETTQIGDIL